MEKRKQINLQSYFTRSMLSAITGVLAICFFWLLLFNLALNSGLILPANAGEIAARGAMDKMRERDEFIEPDKPALYNYIFFDEQGKVINSSLSGDELENELNRYSDVYRTYATGSYLVFSDKKAVLLSWKYRPSFSNPSLQKLMPPADVILLALLVGSSILYFVLYVRYISRKFKNQLELLNLASLQISCQNLDTPLVTSVGIKEFDDSLKAMDDVRIALKTSLANEWHTRIQHKREIAALVHDIKTPLTVINGNAELLIEDSLSPEHQQLAYSIYSAGAKAKQYVDVLQQVSNLETMEEEMKKVSAADLLQDLSETLWPLAKRKNIQLEFLNDFRANLNVYPFMLGRALQNIGENAIRYSPPGTQVTISVTKKNEYVVFTFQDCGHGFSKEALAQAAEMFWQQDKSRTVNGNYGIGLFTADKIAQKHKGIIILQNNDEGACVKLRIPLL